MLNKKKNPAPDSKLDLSKKTRLNNTSSASQRQRLLEWLREKPITTIEARHELNILAPAPRVHELRHKFGWNIKTIWTEAYTPEKHKHRVAKYVLLPGKFKGGKK